MKRRQVPSMGIFTIGIAALFLVGFLLLVFFGAVTYLRTVDSQNENNGERAILSYLSAVTEANDRADAVSVQDSEFGPMLVIREENGFGIRIFHSDGKLLEDYSLLTLEPDAGDATVIAETDRFEISEIGPGIWQVRTDQGTGLFALRSGKEGLE